MTSRSRILSLGGTLLLLCSCGGLSAEQQWGDLEGTFRLVGQAPAPPAVVINNNKAFCGPFNLVDESLIVGRRNGVANVVIYLKPAAGANVPVHEDVARAAKQAVKFDNAKCKFEPRIAIVQVGQTLEIGNQDQIGHNVNAALISNAAFNVLVPQGGKVPKVFQTAEPLPMPVTCNIHPWMQGRLAVIETPYGTVTDDRGTFEIEKLPVGTWDFHVWHEKTANVSAVTIGGAPVEWPKGIAQITIKEGKNDLGVVEIALAKFNK